MEANNWDLPSFDGVKLKIHEMGQDSAQPLASASSSSDTQPTVILLHGLFSNAYTNWIKFGHAALLAEAGFRVIMPDLRAHGQSDAPHEADAYPKDVLIKDIHALITHLDLPEYDLGGFSLGARTTARLLTELSPRKAILAGMGLEGLSGWNQRQGFFLKAIELRDTAKRDDPHWMAIQFMKSQKIDVVAAAHLLKTFSDMEPDAIQIITTPTLVLCGSEDRDNGDPEALAQLLPNGHHVAIPGTHMSSVTKPELGQEILKFLNS
ncbi:alpha/beta hydrolase [Parasphingorhabdus sp. JC815]|uniref:alpha/beta fold hydrolase n=1 Tax=Parasphingorhabdus sp. JC815 TaxID=3232140 RepID=UPI003459ACB1